MRTLILATALMLATSANAEITGPTTSTTGSYVLTWTGPPESFLVEYDNANGGWAHFWTDPTVPVTRPDGTYHYSTLTCTFLPFFELYCVPHANHQVHVVIGGPPGVQYPQPPAEQAEYEYEIRLHREWTRRPSRRPPDRRPHGWFSTNLCASPKPQRQPHRRCS